MYADLHHRAPHHHRDLHGRRVTRPTGGEFRALAWLFRHPLFLLVPVALLTSAIVSGWVVTASTVAGLVLAVTGWARIHPASFDRLVAPRLRAGWRRWTCYRGRSWTALLSDCGLVRDNPTTGRRTVPRLVRVRSASRSIDTLYVRPARGQDLHTWTQRTDALADGLLAHRVAVARVRPGLLALVVEREMPFTHAVPAPPIPDTAAEIDLRALDVGDNEHGAPFRLPVLGTHVLVAGATGSGKGSLLWAPLRTMGPAIRDGLVRVRMIDLKGGAETSRGAPLFHRYATAMDDALALLTEARDEMRARQKYMRDNGLRRLVVTADHPLELVVIDEMAMLTAYGERSQVREALRLLAEILTQGRAGLVSVMGYVQEPSKDVVDVRELFPTRVCLGVTATSHVDMVLGDGARERGALADEIPGDPAHAGIGFVIDTGSRLPVRFRAAHVTDRDIDELAARCAPTTPAGGV